MSKTVILDNWEYDKLRTLILADLLNKHAIIEEIKLLLDLYDKFDKANNEDFLEIMINEFVDLFDGDDLEDYSKYCDWMNGRGCPFEDDDEMTCIHHFKEYYLENYIKNL